jgi:hypothetical protein
MPNYALQRTQQPLSGAATLLFHLRERRGCNRSVPCAGSLSLVVSTQFIDYAITI